MSEPVSGGESPPRPVAGVAPEAPVWAGRGAPSAERRSRSIRWPGVLSGTLAFLMVAAWVVALAVATAGPVEVGIMLSFVSMVLSVLAVVFGVIAVIGEWARGWGVTGIVVGALLNPLVLLYGLNGMGSL